MSDHAETEARREKWRIRSRRHYQTHRAERIARAIAYQKAHPEKINRERKREIEKKYRLTHPDQLKNWYSEHPGKAKEYSAKARQLHPEREQEAQRKYREVHPERKREATRRWQDAHPEIIAMKKAVAHMLAYSEMSKTAQARQYIGCSPGFFRNHLESLFQPDMTWMNYGEWHVDHIVPLAWWDLGNHPEHLFEASHWSNLRPLWGTENMVKGARYAA